MLTPDTLKAMVLATGLALAAAPSAAAPGAGWGNAATGDPDRDAAQRALQEEDWEAAAAALAEIARRRPFDDDVHAQLGFANRKRGHHELALEHYRRALALNPYHRGAMAYLGEAYLALGETERARAMLECLARTCERAGKPAEDCAQWRALDSALRAVTARP